VPGRMGVGVTQTANGCSFSCIDVARTFTLTIYISFNLGPMANLLRKVSFSNNTRMDCVNCVHACDEMVSLFVTNTLLNVNAGNLCS